MKEIFKYLGLFSLMCFSFFLTEKTALVVSEVDEIMISIKGDIGKNSLKPIDAIINGDTIIPGIAGREVNVGKSYKSMKKIGVYDSKFLEYDIKKPNISVNDNLDKYIISGNTQKRMVSLVFIADIEQIEAIANIVGSNKVSFVVTNNDIDKVDDWYKFGHDFLAGSSYDNKEYKTKGIEAKICYNENKDESFLSACQKNKQYSINIEPISLKPLQTVRSNLNAGSILVFKVNRGLLNELPNIISYIEFKGFKIESLVTHIQES